LFQGQIDGEDKEVEDEEEDEKEHNLLYSYLSLVTFSLVLISFNWGRNIVSEAYGYKGIGDDKAFFDLKHDVPTLTTENFGTLVGLC
jgi:hypothetical protein